jgi:hypothetical protein
LFGLNINKMSAAGLLAGNRISSATHLGSGISIAWPTINGNVLAGPTSTTNVAHSTGLYTLTTVIDFEGGGAAAGDFFYTLSVGGAAVLQNFIPAEQQDTAQVTRVDNLIFINAGSSATVNCQLAYGSTAGALNTGATGFVTFTLTRVC